MFLQSVPLCVGRVVVGTLQPYCPCHNGDKDTTPISSPALNVLGTTTPSFDPQFRTGVRPRRTKGRERCPVQGGVDSEVETFDQTSSYSRKVDKREESGTTRP